MPLDNKISNIIGTKLPQWVLNQLETRSNKNTQDSRDNDNILYLSNKSAWVRLVSSVDVSSEDMEYFRTQFGANVKRAGFGPDLPELNPIFDPTSLAKQYTLFGGTSKYLNKNSYGLRSGIDYDGAYGMLGKSEVQQFGYKPMPGITNVSIDTQGRLGSVRAATINFKCWDKNQLDIMDALYFKLGFTMFLEWGHTYFYYSGQNNQNADPNKIVSTELYSIDPFEKGLNKEDIQLKIAQNSRNTEGNYDAMLGIVTNFNFTYTQDGGYDCSVKLMALGVLGDSIKINNSGTLPALLVEEIIQLNNTLLEISNQTNISAEQSKPQLKTIDQVLKDASSNNVIKGTVVKVYPSSPEQLITTTTSIRDGNRTVLTKNTKQVPTGEYTKPDTIIRYSDSGDRYFIITRIGQIVKYDENEQYTGFLDINQLDLYRSNLVTAKNDKIGNFLSNLVLDKSKRLATGGPTVFGSIYELGPRIFKIEYSSKNVDNSGTVGEIKKYIQFEFSDVNFKVAEGTSLLEDIILPAIRKALEGELKVSVYDFKGTPRIQFNGTYQVKGWRWRTTENTTRAEEVQDVLLGTKDADTIERGDSTNKEEVVKEGTFKIYTDDTFIIKDIVVEDTNNLLERQQYLDKLNSQNKKEFVETNNTDTLQDEKEALNTQIKQALNYQSTLEIMLRTIQLHALNKAIVDTNKDLEIGRQTYVLEISDSKDRIKNKTFLSQIFSTGIFSGCINKLVSGSVSDSAYTVDSNGNYNQKMVPQERFEIQSKYGFATSLLGNKAPINEIPAVNFKELLKAYVVPYQINQEIIKGTSTNHPVYIPLGLVLMILNHSCTIYDTNNSGNNNSFQTPLVYIDFNPETNFFLTNGKQLSTDPWTCLIPFQGSFDDYKSLFDKNILTKDGKAIDHTSGSSETVPLFNPETNDFLSGTLPKIKLDPVPPSVLQSKYVSSGLSQFLSSEVAKYSGNLYRGKTMNILLNIDYLVKLAQQYSYKDGTNSVYLKTFIEQMLNDINKSLGNFNAFRLSYNDSANTFQIVDDQFIPSLSNEDQVTPKPKKIDIQNTTELPLAGKSSIAKSLEIKSDISSKLSNMLAISANSNYENKAALSTNGDSFGFINTSYTDRYIPNRGEISGSSIEKSNNDTLKISAQQFNSAISDFYSKINPSETSVSHATNYYIEKMAIVKNNEYATRAAAMIPVSINFTTDGISGLSMYQAFTVPDILLPYTYNTRKIPGAPQDHLTNVGFAVVGLTHTIENNQWNTAVRANMFYLKDKTEFTGSVVRVDKRVGPLGVNENNAVSLSIGSVSLSDLNTNQSWQDIAVEFIAKKEGFLNKPKPDEGTLRAGYGTDKIVTADGTVKSVGIDTVFTKEDARRTLIYQIKNTFSTKIISQIGKQNWDRLNDKQKAALVSYAYNAGSLRRNLVNAIKNNAANQIVANAIIAGPTTGAQSGRVYPALIQRRKEEAALYLS